MEGFVGVGIWDWLSWGVGCVGWVEAVTVKNVEDCKLQGKASSTLIGRLSEISRWNRVGSAAVLTSRPKDTEVFSLFPFSILSFLMRHHKSSGPRKELLKSRFKMTCRYLLETFHNSNSHIDNLKCLPLSPNDSTCLPSFRKWR